MIRSRFLGKSDGLHPDLVVRAVAHLLERSAREIEDQHRRDTSRRWAAYRATTAARLEQGLVIRQVRVSGYVGDRKVFSAVEVPREKYREVVRRLALERFREQHPYAIRAHSRLIDYVETKDSTP